MLQRTTQNELPIRWGGDRFDLAAQLFGSGRPPLAAGFPMQIAGPGNTGTWTLVKAWVDCVVCVDRERGTWQIYGTIDVESLDERRHWLFSLTEKQGAHFVSTYNVEKRTGVLTLHKQVMKP